MGAVITIIKAYLDSTEHRNGGMADPLASFEEWDKLVRQPILWLSTIEGISDIADIKQSINDNLANDPVSEELETMLHGIYAMKGEQPFTAKHIYYDLFDDDGRAVAVHENNRDFDMIDNARLLFAEWTNKREPNAKSIGAALANRLDRPCAGLMLVLHCKDAKRGHQYRLAKV